MHSQQRLTCQHQADVSATKKDATVAGKQSIAFPHTWGHEGKQQYHTNEQLSDCAIHRKHHFHAFHCWQKDHHNTSTMIMRYSTSGTGHTTVRNGISAGRHMSDAAEATLANDTFYDAQHWHIQRTPPAQETSGNTTTQAGPENTQGLLRGLLR